VIVGQEKMIDFLITAILADGHVLIEGVPGVAKTLTSKLLSRIINVDFSRIQFTPDLMPSDVLGTSVYNVKNSEFEFKSGPIFSNIVLIDEINRAPAKTQAALFEVMEERQVTVDGTTYSLSAPFIVLATQNPIEHEGTYRLPEAQLDRFLFKILVDYPSLEEEVAIISGHHDRKGVSPASEVNSILSAEDVKQYRQVVQLVYVEKNLLQYIAQMVHSSRKNPALFLGASPRASVAILNSAKAFAALNGRDFVTPEDVKTVALPVLGHRVILTPDKEMEGITADEVVKQMIDKIEVPR
jgi:MoxR-like ATPase